MLDCPYLLLITESRAVSIICGYGIPKAAVIHKRGTQRPSSAAASRISAVCNNRRYRYYCRISVLYALFYHYP